MKRLKNRIVTSQVFYFFIVGSMAYGPGSIAQEHGPDSDGRDSVTVDAPVPEVDRPSIDFFRGQMATLKGPKMILILYKTGSAPSKTLRAEVAKKMKYLKSKGVDVVTLNMSEVEEDLLPTGNDESGVLGHKLMAIFKNPDPNETGPVAILLNKNEAGGWRSQSGGTSKTVSHGLSEVRALIAQLIKQDSSGGFSPPGSSPVNQTPRPVPSRAMPEEVPPAPPAISREPSRGEHGGPPAHPSNSHPPIARPLGSPVPQSMLNQLREVSPSNQRVFVFVRKNRCGNCENLDRYLNSRGRQILRGGRVAIYNLNIDSPRLDASLGRAIGEVAGPDLGYKDVIFPITWVFQRQGNSWVKVGPARSGFEEGRSLVEELAGSR